MLPALFFARILFQIIYAPCFILCQNPVSNAPKILESVLLSLRNKIHSYSFLLMAFPLVLESQLLLIISYTSSTPLEQGWVSWLAIYPINLIQTTQNRTIYYLGGKSILFLKELFLSNYEIILYFTKCHICFTMWKTPSLPLI